MAADVLDPAYRHLIKLIEFSVDVFCAVDKSGVFVYVSKGCTQALGYVPEEIIGKTIADVVCEEDLQRSNEVISKLTSEINIHHFENRCHHKNGSTVPLAWSAIWDHRGALAYCIARVAAESNDAEIKLQQSEKRFRALVQHSYEMITIIDLQGNYQYNSDSVYRLLGYTEEQLIGTNALRLVHPEDLPKVSAALERLYTERFINDLEPFRFQNSKGDWLWVEVTGTNLTNDPSVQGVVINARDVTEKIKLQKKLESELASRQRKITAAAIKAQERERSQLGIELHDNVNQVLSTIKLYIEMYLSGSVEGNGILQRANAYTQDCINEIRNISRRLSAPTLGDLTLKESVNELVRSVNAGKKVNYAVSVADINVSEELHLALYRIIQEQLVNIDKHANARNVYLKLVKTNRLIRLVIKDDGDGFDPGTQVKGIGLLSIASRVETLKGKLYIVSAKAKGCILKVLIPFEDLLTEE